MLYPVSYSVPEEIIVPYVPFKISHTAQHDYQFQDSQQYLKNYRNSIFGETRLKCGWDCFRHYEILSQGTIPYFHNLQDCPKQTLHAFPKTQILGLMDTYGPMTFDDIMKTSSSILYNDLDSLLQYTKDNLTTRNEAKYVLSKSKFPQAKRVLFVHNTEGKGNYLCEMIAHGLIRHTDGLVDVYPELPHLFDSYPAEEAAKLYGKGFNYTRLIPDRYRKQISEERIWEKIHDYQYESIVMFAECFTDRKIPFTEGERHLQKYYPPELLSVVCGKDCDPYWSPEKNWYIRMNHDCPLKNLSNHLNVFVREFGD